MKWYLAKIVYRIICGDGQHTAQFDEQLRLVYASDETLAFQKAFNTGRSEEESFFNQKEQLVKWKFINVAELYQLDALIDGAELYSRINEVEDASSYISFIEKKASSIRENQSHKLLNLF